MKNIYIKPLDFEMFKKVVIDHGFKVLKETYPEREYVLKEEYVYKINSTKERISFVLKGKSMITPGFVITAFYDEYKDGKPLQECLDFITHCLTTADDIKMKQECDDPKSILNYFLNKENITCFVVNTNQNKEYLSDKPHREFLDLSIVYNSCYYSHDGCMSIILTNQHAELMGITEQELYEIAMENTKRLNAPEIVNIKAMDILPDDIPIPISLDVLTNVHKDRGAVALCMEELLYGYAEKIKDDFFVLPSSLHECMLTPAKESKLCMLEDMVMDANAFTVLQEDRLSNNVYYYARKKRKLSIASTQGKDSLDDDAYASYIPKSNTEAKDVFEC